MLNSTLEHFRNSCCLGGSPVRVPLRLPGPDAQGEDTYGSLRHPRLPSPLQATNGGECAAPGWSTVLAQLEKKPCHLPKTPYVAVLQRTTRYCHCSMSRRQRRKTLSFSTRTIDLSTSHSIQIRNMASHGRAEAKFECSNFFRDGLIQCQLVCKQGKDVTSRSATVYTFRDIDQLGTMCIEPQMEESTLFTAVPLGGLFDSPGVGTSWLSGLREGDNAPLDGDWNNVLDDTVSVEKSNLASGKLPDPLNSGLPSPTPVKVPDSVPQAPLVLPVTQPPTTSPASPQVRSDRYTFHFILSRENPTCTTTLPPLELCSPIVYSAKLKNGAVHSRVMSWASKATPSYDAWMGSSCQKLVEVPFRATSRDEEMVLGLDIFPWVEALKAANLVFGQIQVITFAFLGGQQVWKKCGVISQSDCFSVHADKRVVNVGCLRRQSKSGACVEVSIADSAIHAYVANGLIPALDDNASSSSTVEKDSARDEDPNQTLLGLHIQRCREKLREAQRKDKVYLLSHEDLAPFYGMQRDEVAAKLGICVTLLKKMCRRLGVKTWPYRKLRPVHREIEKKWRNQKIWADNARTGANPRRTAKVSKAEIERIFERRNAIARESLGDEAYAAFARCERDFRSLYMDNRHENV
eukprot:Plantae.Rhodophyta-Rhodochaete_pulchella.ctg21361.p1 GENE.Plantae.Rhodophyta-Rhodochaete_pulchella.ctg21361~~Plantae.Rhodophyta-Rhodochaete_pulchella.ctg21361.p1  ORF type:complete len:634 (-),score=58.29 Plantae.Rhodophyta-Rhodochaete_pulchella.ctg21361:742-2643(-)